MKGKRGKKWFPCRFGGRPYRKEKIRSDVQPSSRRGDQSKFVKKWEGEMGGTYITHIGEKKFFTGRGEGFEGAREEEFPRNNY